MSVRSTLLLLLVAASVALSTMAVALYWSIDDFSDVEADTAADAEDLILYLDVTIRVSRFVKESMDAPGRAPSPELLRAKEQAVEKLDALDKRANRAEKITDPTVNIVEMRARVAKILAQFNTIVRDVDQGHAAAKAGR